MVVLRDLAWKNIVPALTQDLDFLRWKQLHRPLLKIYLASMEEIGSTSIVTSIAPTVVLKSPIEFTDQDFAKRVDQCFTVEPLIFEKLGNHPRIVEYLGRQGRGLLLRKASHGDLQAYIDENNTAINQNQRVRWCRQVTEAIIYAHANGVIHSDIRPRNVLVHQNSAGSLDLLLCDFGGAVCDELDLDGNCLPDGPFYFPDLGTISTPTLDIFSLGSLYYTILTGYWPYRTYSRPPETIDEKMAYEKEIYQHFSTGRFPNVNHINGGNVILRCWLRDFTDAAEVLQAIDNEMTISGVIPD